ncbi:response regulator [Thaumasiovibrio sp. DFM-14]|uniref:response regulator n=1 Tax=Thaumasiovibrio sp. DFM-14 TaxID=3384792 RepID=UPI0039A05EA0
MKLFSSFKRLQHSLMMAFLVISITPLTLTALFFLNSHITDLEQQTFQHLSLLRDNKARQLENYFDYKRQEIQAFAKSELAIATGGRFYGLVGAFSQLANSQDEIRAIAQSDYIKGVLSGKNVDLSTEGTLYIANQRYRLIHKRYHDAFEEYLKRTDFSNIYLVDMNGNVTYSVKIDSLFGENLQNEQQLNTPYGQAFKNIKNLTKQHLESDEELYVFQDFSDNNNAGQNVAWLAAPIIQQGYLHSYLLFKLPTTGVESLVAERPEEQSSITTTVLGLHGELRQSNPLNTLFKSEPDILNALLQQKESVEKITGFNEIKVLRALTPVNVLDNQWAILLDLPESDALVHIRQLEKVFLVAMTAAILLVIMASHWLSNYITAPLLRLTWAAERVSAGDLDQNITGTERPDELGRLAISFARMQRSVREKLFLIRQQNKELESNLDTIQQKNSKLEAADKLKDEFLATTSHELRTPLHGMMGIAESLLSGLHSPISNQQRHQLQILLNSGQRLSTLIDDLLDYHKMRYGNLDIKRHAVDLSTAIRLVLELSHHLLGEKPVRIINQIPNDMPLLDADEQRLEQVLYNLIGNAIKYTSEGKIVISATLLDKQVRVQVVDTGQGIPAEELEQIFEPLTQAADSERYRQGTGLGLTISRQLIELMGGQLYVSSQPMVGSTFSFTLNIASDELKQTASPPLNHFMIPPTDGSEITFSVDSHDGDKELILVVDDEPVNLQVVANYLRASGYRVVTADNGNLAISMVEEYQPDLLLLDVMMPELNGYEVCKRLRQHADNEMLPIIMLSALNQMQDRVKGFEAGASDYLSKPFNKEELLARIYTHLRAAKMLEEKAINVRLQEEIMHHKQTEQGLIDTHGRLINLLESTEESILCLQQDGRIRYANQAAAKLLHAPTEIIERLNIDDLIADMEQLNVPDGNVLPIENLRFKVQGELQQWPARLLPMPEASGLSMIIVISPARQSSQHRVELLEHAVNALSDFAFDGDKSNLQQLRELGGEFTRLADKLNQDEKSKADLMRELTVQAMTASLELWESSTGKTKFALAEESGLWRVYLDRSTLQTRTLDKYLHLDTLPKSPRWRTVISTLDFVLERATLCAARQSLESARDKLHHYMQQ